MKKLSVMIAILIVTIFATHQAMADNRPILAKVHSDNCGGCAKISSTWDALEKRSDIRAIVLDVTTASTTQKAQKTIKDLGIAKAAEPYMTKTATVLVLKSNGELVGSLVKETDLAKYDELISKAGSTHQH